MTTVKQRTHYTPPDLATYMHVLENTAVDSCLHDLPSDPVAFKLACLHAAHAVPLNDPPRGAFNVDAYVRQRLQEALDYRNRYYRSHLKRETIQ